MAVLYRGHRFEASGQEESICRACGFVAGPEPSPAQVERLFRERSIEDSVCPKRWHGFRYRLPEGSSTGA